MVPSVRAAAVCDPDTDPCSCIYGTQCGPCGTDTCICDTKPAGCYNNDDTPASRWTIGQFGYYLTQNECIAGNCACPSGSSTNVPRQTSPDDSSQACSCVAPVSWNSKFKCCGAHIDDCGKSISGVLCSINADSTSAEATDALGNAGKIKYAGCLGSEFLSDGTRWVKCDDTFEGGRRTMNIDGTDFICIGKGKGSIVECCGDGSCKSSNDGTSPDGQRLSTGQSISPSRYQNEGATPICQDGFVNQLGEECDMQDFNGKTCQTQGFADGNLVCTAQCTIDTSECTGTPMGSCGDGVIQSPNGDGIDERCDGSDLGGKTCASFNDDHSEYFGNLKCDSTCKFDSASCTRNDFVKLYDGFGYQGASVKIYTNEAINNLNIRGFDDRTRSIKVPNGLRAFICEDDGNARVSHGNNNCQTFTSDNPTFCDTGSCPGRNVGPGKASSIWVSGTRSGPLPITGGVIIGGKLNANAVQQKSSITGFVVAGDDNAKTFYCRQDKKFVTDLDTHADASLNNINEITCKKAGFNWTGTKCCSENDDNTTSEKEYYNEPGAKNACWKSNVTESISLVSNTQDSVIIYNGEFHGCAIDRVIFNTANDNLLQLKDKHTGNDLFGNNNHNYCFNNPQNNFYCSYSERWLPTSGASTIRLSSLPEQASASQTPYFEFTPNGGTISAGSPATFTLKNGKPGNKLSIKAWKDGTPVSFANANGQASFEAEICSIDSGQNYCTKDSTAQTEDIGHWVEKIMIDNREIGWVNFRVVASSQSSPYFTFRPNGGALVAGRDSWIYELRNANTNDVLAVDAWKDGKHIGILNICSMGVSSPFQIFCTTTSTPPASDIGMWNLNVLLNGNRIGNITFQVVPRADCCGNGQCWNGINCIDNQKGSPNAQPVFSNYRCIDGSWIASLTKYNPEGTASGYCPAETQCLVNPSSQTQAEQCIDSGQYVNDNYCENGNWTSRTKLLALKLLSIRGDDYTLFCDSKENTLNNLQYSVRIGNADQVISSVITGAQANKFCIINTNNNVAVATSINKNLNEVSNNGLGIFGVTSCGSGAFAEDGQYHACDSTNKLWINKKLKSFIYSSGSVAIQAEQPQASSSLFNELVWSPIINLINYIKSAILSLQPSDTLPFEETYLKGIKRFDRLYMTKLGSKLIIGSIEGSGSGNRYAFLQYSNFDNDICKLVSSYNTTKYSPTDPSSIYCKKEGNNYQVYAKGSDLTNINPNSIWPDLTSKLRIK